MADIEPGYQVTNGSAKSGGMGMTEGAKAFTLEGATNFAAYLNAENPNGPPWVACPLGEVMYAKNWASEDLTIATSGTGEYGDPT